MTDTKLQAAFAAAEEKRRRAAILKDSETMPLDFDPVTNPGVYAEDEVWKRFWKTEGIRALHADGSVITDQMERFRQAFELGYMACRKIENGATTQEAGE
jgi:hypothetical protein